MAPSRMASRQRSAFFPSSHHFSQAQSPRSGAELRICRSGFSFNPWKGRTMPKKEDQRSKASRQTSALSLLEQDHREVEGFFDEYETLTKAEEKEALAVKICLALEVHTRIEEEIFYPAARGAIDNPELIDEATVEHTAAKQLIAEIEAMEVGDQLLDAKVKVLGEQIRHHVEEEENELFPKLQKGKLDLDALGREMGALKQELVAEVIEGGEAL
jgi:hypothetical protein